MTLLLQTLCFFEMFSDAITALAIVIGGLFALVKFFEYLNDKRFNNYHRLIKELVDKETQEAEMREDRQIAVIFELRSYRSYYKVTRRILENLKIHWKDHPRLVNEIDLTLEYMNIIWRRPLL